MGPESPEVHHVTVAVAQRVRYFTRAVIVGVVAGMVAPQAFGMFSGVEVDMVAIADPPVPAERLVADQERLGLTCQEEPVLTDVVIFQFTVPDGAPPNIQVLTFDEALVASRASDGWVRSYCA